MKRRGFSHYAAPIAFLVAVTIAVLLVRSAFRHGSHPQAVRTTTTEATTTRPHRKTHHPPHVSMYTVQSGDTFESIARKTGTTVARLEQLNPGANPNALQVGQTIRVK